MFQRIVNGFKWTLVKLNKLFLPFEHLLRTSAFILLAKITICDLTIYQRFTTLE